MARSGVICSMRLPRSFWALILMFSFGEEQKDGLHSVHTMVSPLPSSSNLYHVALPRFEESGNVVSHYVCKGFPTYRNSPVGKESLNI